MLKWFISLVTVLAFVFGEAPQIHWVYEWPHLDGSLGICGIENYGMAHIATVTDNFASVTYMLAVVAPKAT